MGWGGAFIAGAALGPLVDGWITRQLAVKRLKRPDCWRPATRWMLSAAMGVGWAASWVEVGWTGTLPAHLAWVMVTSAVVITDLEHKLIPNRILYPGGVLTAVLLVMGAFVDKTPGRLGPALLSGALCLVGMGMLSAAGRGALGMGDVKLSALLGLMCGYWGMETAFWAVVVGFLIGGAAALILLLSRRAQRRTQIPFAPALVAAAWLSWLAQPF